MGARRGGPWVAALLVVALLAGCRAATLAPDAQPGARAPATVEPPDGRVAESVGPAPTTTLAGPSPTALEPAPTPGVTAPRAPIAPASVSTLPDPAPEISVPAGYRAWRWVELAQAPTALAWGPDQRLYVSTFDGTILSFGGDALAGGAPITAAAGLQGAQGLAFQPGTRLLYTSRAGGVDRLADADGDGVYEGRQAILNGLPAARHSTNDVEFGSDGQLYVATGSVDDMGKSGEDPPFQATILRSAPDGSGLEVFARGLRNPYGLAFDASGQLWATDNGGDVPEGQPDELNRIQHGGDYGWPGCFGVGQESVPGACQGTIPPVAVLAAHSSSNGIVVYEDDLVIAQWGSAFPDKPAGREVVRVDPSNGTVTSFASGFDHPLAVLLDPRDGGLWVADFGAGDGSGGAAIYKIVRVEG